jgi:hypothetical protein
VNTNDKTKILLPVLTALVIGGSLLGVSVVHAQDTAGSSQSIVQKIASKFGLNVAEVQSVFDEEHSSRMATMKAEQETKLTQAVTDGKITEDQKTAILTKHAEMQANQPTDPKAFKDMTDEQRKAEMETKKSEMEAWASEHGLSTDTLRDLMGHGGPGFGDGHGPRMK